ITTAEDRKIATAAGIPITSTCWDPKNRHVGMDAGQAKVYLNSLPQRPLSKCAPPTEANINSLNDTFAICAARFFKEYTTRYGTVYITSAFRDDKPGTAGDGSGKSANQCAGGVPNSNHAKGIALDVNPSSESLYPMMWKFATENPQFGVCFPFQDKPLSGYPNGDRPHMVLAGTGGGEAAKCAEQGITKPCSGTNYDPNAVRSVSAATSGYTAPTSSWANTLRSALGLAPAVAPQPTQPQATTPTQQSALNSFGTPTTGTFVTPTGTGETYTTATSGTINTPPIEPLGSSTIAQTLEQLAFGTSTNSATSSILYVPLTINGNDRSDRVASVSPTIALTPTGYTLPQIQLTTFTSNDLQWSNTEAERTSTSDSATIRTLEALRAALMQILSYLQPFRARSSIYEGTE
ncbi:MAG: hypothetical protein ABL856_11750, partial [Gallionella sp.]